MVDKVELSGFLDELISILKKKFEVYDGNIKSMREDIRKLTQAQGTTSIRELENRIRILENTVNSMRARTQVDTSLLKVLESEEHERRP
jgi:prefoldin subunit 5